MFPTDVIQYLRLGIYILRQMKWIFVAAFYYGVVIATYLTRDFRLPLVAVLCPLISGFAYFHDRKREEHGLDDFRGNRLFLRYGELLDLETIAIPVNKDWDFKATEISAHTLRLSLAQRIAARFPEGSVQVSGNSIISDLKSKEQKEFVRVLVRSPFGSMVTFFIHYAAFGHTITAHYYTLRRGTHGDWDIAKFILASPVTVWFWLLPWLLNRYSITATISHYRNSSFDSIDLLTMFCAVHRVVYGETQKMLEEVHLLTEEIRQQITNYIQNFNQIAVTNSANVNVGNGNVVHSSAASPQPPRK